MMPKMCLTAMYGKDFDFGDNVFYRRAINRKDLLKAGLEILMSIADCRRKSI